MNKEDEETHLDAEVKSPAAVKRGQRAFRTSVFVADSSVPKKGYLRKKASSGILSRGLNAWQRRYFVAKNHYFVYYKNEESQQTVLATVDLALVERIYMITDCDFCVGDYQLRATTGREALDWVNDLKNRKEKIMTTRKLLKELEIEDKKKMELENKKGHSDSVAVALHHLSHDTDKKDKKKDKKGGGVASTADEGSDDEEDVDSFGGLLDDALYEMFTGNINVLKLSPSPARDNVRLALSALALKEKNDHDETTKTIQSKEALLNQIKGRTFTLGARIADRKDRVSSGNGLKPLVIPPRITSSSVSSYNSSSANDFESPPSEIPQYIWNTVKSNSDDLSHLPIYLKYDILVERAKSIIIVVNKSAIKKNNTEGENSLNIDEETKANEKVRKTNRIANFENAMSSSQNEAFLAEKLNLIAFAEKEVNKLTAKNKLLESIFKNINDEDPMKAASQLLLEESKIIYHEIQKLREEDDTIQSQLLAKNAEHEEIFSKFNQSLQTISTNNDEDDDDDTATILDTTNKILHYNKSIAKLRSSWASDIKSLFSLCESESLEWNAEKIQIQREIFVLQNLLIKDPSYNEVENLKKGESSNFISYMIQKIDNLKKNQKVKNDMINEGRAVAM